MFCCNRMYAFCLVWFIDCVYTLLIQAVSFIPEKGISNHIQALYLVLILRCIFSPEEIFYSVVKCTVFMRTASRHSMPQPCWLNVNSIFEWMLITVNLDVGFSSAGASSASMLPSWWWRSDRWYSDIVSYRVYHVFTSTVDPSACMHLYPCFPTRNFTYWSWSFEYYLQWPWLNLNQRSSAV